MADQVAPCNNTRSKVERRLLRACVAVALVCACDQTPGERVVATVAGRPISVAEFDRRARLLLEGEDAPSDSSELRARLLDLLIAGELLSLEGEHRGLHREKAIADEVERLERRLLIEAMHEWIYADLDPPTEAEIEDLYRQWGEGRQIRASHILCRTREEAEAVLAELERPGASFGELARSRSIHRMSALAGGDMGYMREEELLAELRDPVWTLPVGAPHPQPLESRLGYHIVKVTDRRTAPLDSMRAVLTGTLRERQRQAATALQAQRLRLRYGFAWKSAVARALVEDPSAPAVDSLAVLASWEGGSLTAARFLREVRRFGIGRTLSDTAEARMRGEEMMRDELFLAEARALGYNREPRIRREVADRQANLVARRLFALEAVARVDLADSSLRAWYEARRGKYRVLPKVSVQEILLEERGAADSLMALLAGGADMADLARRHSARVWAREEGGRLGVLDMGSPGYRELVADALKADAGSLRGPIESGSGFSLYRVLEHLPERPATFAEVEALVKEDMRAARMDQFIDSLRAAREGQIAVDEDALRLTLREASAHGP